MFLLKRNFFCKCFRIIKKYWLRTFTFLFVFIIVTIFIREWKNSIELIKINEMIKAQKRNIQKMVSLSTTKMKMNDTWRIPDVNRAGIFSAYLDSRPEVVLEELSKPGSKDLWALIRIFAIVLVNSESSALTCYYRFSTDPPHANADKSRILESPAIAVRIIAKTENFGMPYSAAFVLCKLITTEDGRYPLEITFSSHSGKTLRDLDSADFVDIHYTTRIATSEQNRFMAACVPSLHHNYDKYVNLIEFVEFYRMMGVEHFIFYNTSVSKEVSRVLTYYENLDVATVIQWQLPSHYMFERTLRYNGIFAAMNECLYRSTMVGGFKYVTNVDLDEFIVPRKHENFQQMMDVLDSGSEEDQYAAFIFRNMFFYLMHEDNPIPQNPPDLPKLLLHTKTTRVKKVNPAYDRSKYIARGQEIIEMGNHRVWQMRKISLVFGMDFREKIVDPDIAGSHHYRNCEVNELVCWLRETVVDAAAHKFTSELGNRVALVLKKVF